MHVGSLTLILPAYNEEERLGPALDELFAYLHGQLRAQADGSGPRQIPTDIRVLVVDDGSTDRTAELAGARPEAKQPIDGIGLRVLSVPHAGKGAAVKAGMLQGDGDVLVFTDADMATPPNQLPLLLDALATADVALGSRIQPDGSDMRQSQPLYRRLLGKAFHLLASLWVVGPVKDTQCGFKGFRRAVAHDVFAQQRIGSIVFDVELIYLCRRRGYRLAVVPIQWFDRRGSRMRTSPGLALRVAWDLFRIPLIHRRLKTARAAGSSSGPSDGGGAD